MRRIFQFSMACAAACAVSACSDPEQVVPTENVPTAGVRFINAVPDTGGSSGLDFRFVDIVEDNPHFNIRFRNNPVTSAGFTASTQIEFKNTRAGNRHFRIFLSDTGQVAASTVIKDSTMTVEAGKLYTVMLWGNARGTAPALKLSIWEDVVPDPAAQVGLRVINAGTTAVDVRLYPDGGTVPAAATWASVAPLSVSTFVNQPKGSIRYNVQPAGGGAVLFADALALPGVAATVDIEAAPGTTIAGSAVTAIIFPKSVAGSKAPQTAAFLVPAVSFMWDRRPPR
jgi:hypothetical protein